jgi:nucleoid DNA-binding protein|tara:strand:- start:2938 stop:3237 length:300 start_codon:yes stop_codon:yes gene_type:complete
VKIKRTNLTKKDISNTIQEKFGLSKNYAAIFLDDLINELISDFKNNKDVKIHNFGSFKTMKKNKRIGRNPKNKEIHLIEERNVLTFKISKLLDKQLNDT